MKDTDNQILKVIVGSQAHGLANPNSDFDYRGVFITPTKELMKLGNRKDETRWIEGNEDDTSWELGKFLSLAVKCKPTILETFKAPILETTPLGNDLRALFGCVWNSQYVHDAYIGYGLNQRKKFLENKDVRPAKYACAYLRTLYNAWEILFTGSFSINMSETPIFEILKRWKAKDYSVGEVIQTCVEWEKKVHEVYDNGRKKETDVEQVNAFLIRTRKKCWDGVPQ